jgi:RES domain-containing protein
MAVKPLRAHVYTNKIIGRVKECLRIAKSFDNTAYRIASPKWCTIDTLFSGGSQTGGSWFDGARWNPPGLATGSQRPSRMTEKDWLLREGFRTVYTSTTLATAIAEVFWHAKRATPAEPLRHNFWDQKMVGMGKVKLSCILDLRSPRTLRILGVDPAPLLGNWIIEQTRGREAFTQLIGRAARLHGFQGILCHSARLRSGTNLVIFPDNCGEERTWLEHLKPTVVPFGGRRY